MIVIPLPWTRPVLSHNQRLHWSVKARETARVRTLVGYLAQGKVVAPPCEVVLVWTVSDKRRRDTDNVSLKACIDGLCDAGVFPDDNSDVVVRSWCEIERGPVKGMRLEVREVRR